MICAACDIGSNTLRFVIAEVLDKKVVEIIEEKRFIIRLAKNIEKERVISNEALSRLIEALKVIKKDLEKYGNIPSRFVATSALREAENREDVIKAALNLGIKIDIISPEEEAALMFKGVASVINLICQRGLIFDIGGGSTEYVIAKGGKIEYLESLDLGVVKLSDRFDFSKKVDKGELVFLAEFIESKLSQLPSTDIDICVATAGTATTLAAIDLKLEQYDYKKVNGYRLSYERIKEIVTMLYSLDLAERQKVVGLEEKRADLIVPGGFIILLTMERYGIDEVVISDFGLREGILVSCCK
jgi:exopolyphosphatase/guanosine-5'-triphosphate,3'-diphosphate pyrophosphatase